MIHVIAPGNEQNTAQLLVSALTRSCGLGSANLGSYSLMQRRPSDAKRKDTYVLIHPREEWSNSILELLATGTKMLILGRLTTGLATYLNVKLAFEWPDGWAEGTLCPPAPIHGQAESTARVVYAKSRVQVAGQPSVMGSRAFRRYDYADEWNNLGHGAITADGSCWSIAQHATLRGEHELARIEIAEEHLCSYAGLWDLDRSSVLWFNRAAGPVDSQEWRMVENFLSCHRSTQLTCVPVLAEIPYGYDSAVTMRLDCDEDVESARALWDLYREEQVPFSLALHSKVLSDSKHHHLPREVLAHGGAILSHTATHAPNWGGTHQAAQEEGRSSAQAIKTATGHQVRYAVSPFHQTPHYARSGLADAGYQGCIGGIIRNDPDFLMARAGIAPGSGAGFIGHSQQCMMHGDCMLEGKDPLRVFREAFETAKVGGAFFGYLDHPFSERYTYGWASEAQRVAAHLAFIVGIRASGGQVLWANEVDAMDFLYQRSHTSVSAHGGGYTVQRPEFMKRWTIGVRYQGNLIPVETKVDLL